MSVRVRYAPSPTGDPHLGNYRTVLFDYLFARHHNGSFIVRIEDTDQTRKVEDSEKRILEGLYWLGITPDEGVCLDGKGNLSEKGGHGPYTQSKRLKIYKKYADQLVKEGKAYRCFCTGDRLAAMREEQQKNHQPPRYDRTCRSIDTKESAERAKREPFVIRQAMPLEGEVVVEDEIRGGITFRCAELDDHVLMKSDGFPTYQLANVVDDHLMEITHVFRGEEWIPSAPKNILLYKDFGWQPPKFAHMPLILGPDKSKLSKRHGALPLLSYRDQGYLPEAMLNVLAFLGWSPGTEQEIFTRDGLIKSFSLERVQPSAAVFDSSRLDYVNGWYIRQMQLGEVVDHMLPFWLESGLIKRSANSHYALKYKLDIGKSSEEYLLEVAFRVQERLKYFAETVDVTRFFLERPSVTQDLKNLLVPKKGTPDKTALILKQVVSLLGSVSETDWSEEKVEEVLRGYIAANGYSNTEVLWPIRAGLTGVPASPGAFEMLATLGKGESLARLKPLL